MGGDLPGDPAAVQAEAMGVTLRDHNHCFRGCVPYRLRRIIFSPYHGHLGNTAWDLYSNHYCGLWQFEPQHNHDRSRAVELAPIG